MTYGMIKSAIVGIALLVALGLFAWRVYQLLWVNLHRGQSSGKFGRWGERIVGLLQYVAPNSGCFESLCLELPTSSSSGAS